MNRKTTRSLRVAILLASLPWAGVSMPQPADWVPARWPWSEPKTLELLADSPVNCLLLRSYTPEFVAAAAKQGVVTLAVISPDESAAAGASRGAVDAARRALATRLTGIVLEGDFPDSVAAAVRQAAGDAPVIELTSRNRLHLGSASPVIGTWQGVWPGVVTLESRVGPTGSIWINTNTGFIRAVRAWGGAALWVANEPPPKTAVTAAQYQQAVADAALSGARWVLAFDRDFAARLHDRGDQAVNDWKAINRVLRYFEEHREWRHMRPYGKLVLIQDPAKGGLVSGGILDMIAVKRMPLRVVPRQRLTAEALQGASVVVNLDTGPLTAAQQKLLSEFKLAGGSLLTAPPGWTDAAPKPGRFTLDKPDVERLGDIGQEVNAMVSRGSMGVRVFNAATMLSNVLISDDARTIVVHLVNYSDYPVQDLTVMFPGSYKRVSIATPEGPEPAGETFPTPDGLGIGVGKVTVCAAITLLRL
jgi:hypothetical protein